MRVKFRHILIAIGCAIVICLINSTFILNQFNMFNEYQTGGYPSASDLSKFEILKSIELRLKKLQKKGKNEYTSNPLIEQYGQNDLTRPGENGTPVIFSEKDKNAVAKIMNEYRVNILASDKTPLNRMVPDSRMKSCQNIKYEDDLPSASIIIPFHDEWPSILKRTIYSIVNRTPRHLLREIILVDDKSTFKALNVPLGRYVKEMFPKGLVKIIRNPTRQGLIISRMNGWRNSTGEVTVFFDSHMEVNIDWLQPLLSAIKKDRQTIAMGNLDYIQADTFEYQFYRRDHIVRYVFDWRLYFWESRFRPDQYGPTAEAKRPGAVMVGPAMAVDSKYFSEIGAYDEGMKIWGGENLELPWRVWMCGGEMVHMPCSKVGHIARPQPYSFPSGRRLTEMYNYKRAVDVWMDPEYKKFVYDFFPEMKNMDVGDLSERLTLKEKLKCKNFTWYLKNVRPELLVYDKNVFAWGSAKNMKYNTCLDNNGYLLTYEENFYSKNCTGQLRKQGFSWTRDRLLRTTLHCVALTKLAEITRPKLVCCIIGPKQTWEHKKNHYIKHEQSGLCLDQDAHGLIMRKCSTQIESQNWTFTHYNI